jgi:hypothetical protein
LPFVSITDVSSNKVSSDNLVAIRLSVGSGAPKDPELASLLAQVSGAGAIAGREFSSSERSLFEITRLGSGGLGAAIAVDSPPWRTGNTLTGSVAPGPHKVSLKQQKMLFPLEKSVEISVTAGASSFVKKAVQVDGVSVGAMPIWTTHVVEVPESTGFAEIAKTRGF